MNRPRKVLLGATVVAVSAGLFAGVAGSGPQGTDPASGAVDAAREAHLAGRSRPIGSGVAFMGVWRNGQMHIVQVQEERFKVGGDEGPEVIEMSAPEASIESQLPPRDPGLDHLQPTEAQIADMRAKVDEMQARADAARGIPSPNLPDTPPGHRPPAVEPS